MGGPIYNIRNTLLTMLNGYSFVITGSIPVSLWDQDITAKFQEYVNTIKLGIVILPFDLTLTEDYINISEYRSNGTIRIVELVDVNRETSPTLNCTEVADNIFAFLKNYNLNASPNYQWKITVDAMRYIKPTNESALAIYEIDVSVTGMIMGNNDLIRG